MAYRDEVTELHDELMARNKLLWCIVRSMGGLTVSKEWIERNYPVEGAQLEERIDKNGDLTLIAKDVFRDAGAAKKVTYG